MLMATYHRCVCGLIKFDTGTSTGGQALSISSTHLIKLVHLIIRETVMIHMEGRTCVLLELFKISHLSLDISTTEHLIIHPMHVGFKSDMGGSSINLRWFHHKSNLHHVLYKDNTQVWDREIILTAAEDYHGKDMHSLLQDIQMNFTEIADPSL